MDLRDLIRDSDRLNVTDYDNEAIYIEKPQEDGWYHPNPFNVVFDILIENGFEFDVRYFSYKDVFEIDGGLFIVIYEED